MDIRTLFFCLIIVNAVLGFFMFVSIRVQKAYPGVYHWASSCLVMACGYLLWGLRGRISDLLSVVVAAVLFGVVAWLRLAGIRRFFGAAPRYRQLLSLPLLFMAFGWLRYVQNSEVARSVVLTGFLDVFIFLTAAEIWRNRNAANAALYVSMVAFYAFDGLFLTARALSWFIWPHTVGFLLPTFMNGALFTLQMGVDIIWVTFFFAMNAQRMNEEVAERNLELVELHKSQKLEMVGKLAGGVAHDFNNMLTAIGFSAEYLAGQPEGDAAQKECAKDILEAVHHAASITRRLLALSSRQLLFPVVLDMNQMVKGMEDTLRSLLGEKIELKAALSPSPEPVKADPGQIEQVILALVMNARDAMPRGGVMTISTAGMELSNEFLKEHLDMKPGQYVTLTVKDTGVGMDAHVMQHLFEPFFTTKKSGEGTGLGLSMAYGVVKQSGGTIIVDSEQGSGTRFDVYLPRTREQAQNGRPPAAGSVGESSETVLLVEDNDAVRRFTLRMLRKAGYEVLEARSAEEAIPLAREHRSSIRLLLSDVMMPGMNGPELARRLSSEMPGLKVLFVSGYPDDVLKEEGVLEDGVQLLMKPFTSDGLAKKMREVLDKDQ